MFLLLLPKSCAHLSEILHVVQSLPLCAKLVSIFYFLKFRSLSFGSKCQNIFVILKPVLIGVSSHFSLRRSPWKSLKCFLSLLIYLFCIFHTNCIGLHVRFSLASFTQHNAFQGHPHCSLC